MSTAARKRELRAAAKASGVCVRCIAKPATRGAYCDRCRAYYDHRADPLPVMRMLCGGGPRCQCPGCGQTRWKFLTFDHVDNDGYLDNRRGRLRIRKRLDAIRREPHRFQVLCFNCNCAKGMRGKGRCPYEGTPH